MNERLSLTQIALLTTYALGMVGGQLLFKLAAGRDAPGAAFDERLLLLMQNGYFIAAVTLYFFLALFWVWLLTFTPLSRAYPFVALAFALTPLAAGFYFAEPLTGRLLAGLAAILVGLFLIVG